jgi:hypothetical protein
MVVCLLLAGCGPRHRAELQLTSDLRAAYGFTETTQVFPVAVIGEVVAQGITPDSASRALRRVRDRIIATHWVQGHDAAGNPFYAQTLDFPLEDGSTYTIALIFKDGTLSSVDTPDYLGKTTPLPGDSMSSHPINGAS